MGLVVEMERAMDLVQPLNRPMSLSTNHHPIEAMPSIATNGPNSSNCCYAFAAYASHSWISAMSLSTTDNGRGCVSNDVPSHLLAHDLDKNGTWPMAFWWRFWAHRRALWRTAHARPSNVCALCDQENWMSASCFYTNHTEWPLLLWFEKEIEKKKKNENTLGFNWWIKMKSLFFWKKWKNANQDEFDRKYTKTENPWKPNLNSIQSLYFICIFPLWLSASVVPLCLFTFFHFFSLFFDKFHQIRASEHTQSMFKWYFYAYLSCFQ